jgi:hypothetical protein
MGSGVLLWGARGLLGFCRGGGNDLSFRMKDQTSQTGISALTGIMNVTCFARGEKNIHNRSSKISYALLFLVELVH